LVGAAAVLEAGNRGRVDHMSFLAVLENCRDQVTDTVNDAPDVDPHHEIPVGGRHVDQAGSVHRHAGIVAGDVKLAEIPSGFRQGIED
jgi:hypothetical protein